MTWIPALQSPWLWGLLAAVPIGIVLLYFLKLRREPVEVPSTYLWMRTIEDLHVNSLLQRLRRSLLLLAQLLVVALAAIALFRPGLRGQSESLDRMVFLLDSSASMQATDLEGNTRFEAAKEMIGGQIDAMTDQDSAMLITFDDRAKVMQSFTSDRRRLRDALQRSEVSNRSTDVLSALRAADGLANPRRSSEMGDVNDVQVADAMPATLKLYSDGGFSPVTEFDLGNLTPEYHAVGTGEVDNLAIIAFSAQRNVEDPTQVQAFATIANAGTVDVSTTVSLMIGDDLVDAQAVDVGASEQTGISFAFAADEATTMRLRIDRKDQLDLDNVAYAGLSPIRSVRVLVVTPGNEPLELALATEKAAKICTADVVSPDFLESESFEKRMLSGVDDLVIFDRCRPDALPATNTFFIGALPPGEWSWRGDPQPVVLVDVDRSHPLLRFVDLFSLLIFQGRSLDGPDGSAVLVEGDAGPVLTIAPRDGYQDLVLGFEVVSQDDDGATVANTNWYAERSWPVFILNVLRYLAGAAEAGGAPSHPTGQTVRLRLESAVDEVTVGREAEAARTIQPSETGFLEVVDTDQPGNYLVRDDDRVLSLFSINLFDRTESRIAAKPEIELGYRSVEAADNTVQQRQEYWRIALLVMLGLLAVEWWYFGKRIA
ncbi:vWA domain-containing protein [Crateriforma spongiae]|uniref:vWA domain-containing protein n=1 Tax=Crateriforma spongiae TaxID=2724528 RepID=UPI0014485C44|nr:BatA and WFA domain-containing protein [Crateriforma spongiae]